MLEICVPWLEVIGYVWFNPLAPELFFFYFQHTLCIKCE